MITSQSAAEELAVSGAVLRDKASVFSENRDGGGVDTSVCRGRPECSKYFI